MKSESTPQYNPVDTVASGGHLKTGILYGLAAFGSWGILPIYFKALSDVSPKEILAHRIVWSCLLLLLMVTRAKAWPELISNLKTRNTAMIILITTCLIAINWFVFIWAISNKVILQASLGYFINPILNVALGYIFLRERLTILGSISVALAMVGVVFQTLQTGSFPFVAIALALSFGFYGLLRKIVKIDAVTGLTVETILLAPLAIGYMIFLKSTDQNSFLSGSGRIDILLLLAGFITALPLVWFTRAARRLPLTTLGFLQYLTPSLQFLLAVAVYGEVLGKYNILAFGFIWVALALYSYDSMRKKIVSRRRHL